ncbi:hypothetical protein [Mucilaginibacter sp.]|uniref:hypothetical protein n=1 Tax=Mucilaginibacter sp. TaxID=1882438 RepID=UPI003D114CEA
MKQKEVFKKIGGIIQELSDQYEYLQTVTDDLNDLELELFVSNAHFLTDHIEILCKLNLQNTRLKRQLPADRTESTYEQQKFFEPVVQQMKPGNGLKNLKFTKPTPKPVAEPEPEAKKIITPQPEEQPVPEINLSAESPADSYSFIREEEPETIRHELVLDESENWDDDEPSPEIELQKEPEIIQDEIPFIIEEPVTEIETIEAEPIAQIEEAEEEPVAQAPKEEKAEEEVLTRNQRMSSQMAASKTDLANIKPISDIKLAITLNDKLLYVKDLFNGYNLAYSEAIEILNRFNTFEEASRFLKTNYVTKNNWEGKPATTEKFYALLRRRYA